MTDNELTPAQESALAAVKAARGACPTPEAIVEYEVLGAGDRRRRPEHDHIQVCSRCQLVLLHVNEPEHSQRSSMLTWALPLAAVAVLALGLTLIDRRGGGAMDDPAATVRGTEIQVVAPSGTIDTLTEFAWQSPIRADRYRVKVSRGPDLVWQGETNAQRLDAPAGVFESNVEYRWLVEGIDREGEVRMTSPPQTFTSIRRR